MLVCALSTARAGSKSVPNKNTMIIKGQPLYLHNVLESMLCPEVYATYVTTDIDRVFSDSENYGFQTIRRPDHLCMDSSTHDETILHGLLEIESRLEREVDILVVMLGNTMNVSREIIKEGLCILDNDPVADSVITVIKANHFNPVRAYVPNKYNSTYLDTFLDQELIREKTENIHLADKNSVGNIYFQNGLWLLRRRAIVRGDGILPFRWLGKKIRFIIQDSALQEIDDIYQIKLLQ
jgi:N-acylneuraminate cytidylyltransferase